MCMFILAAQPKFNGTRILPHQRKRCTKTSSFISDQRRRTRACEMFYSDRRASIGWRPHRPAEILPPRPLPLASPQSTACPNKALSFELPLRDHCESFEICTVRDWYPQPWCIHPAIAKWSNVQSTPHDLNCRLVDHARPVECLLLVQQQIAEVQSRRYGRHSGIASSPFCCLPDIVFSR